MNISKHEHSPAITGMYMDQCKHTWIRNNTESDHEAQIQCALDQLRVTKDKVVVNDEYNPINWLFGWGQNNVDERLIELTKTGSATTSY